MNAGSERLESLRRMMDMQGLDGLVCRLPHNVLMASGYWPMNGLSLAILPRDGDPALVMPRQDERWATDSFITDRRTFTWGGTRTMDLLAQLLPPLRDVARDRELNGKRLGIEQDYPIGALPAWSPEVRQFTQASLRLIREAFDDSGSAEFHDVWLALHAETSRKTSYEIDRIRVANQIAGLALEAFAKAVRPGRTECEIAADVEHAVNAYGPGMYGVKLARAWAHVMSGANGHFAGQTYNMTTDRIVQEGEPVSVELGVVADGYWSDLTRVHIAGEPSRRQREIWDLVTRAHDAAAATIKVGAPWSQIDAAARGIIEEAGYGDAFPHITGHGVGFCYHEPTPLIGPGIPGNVEPNQIVAIEPAIYPPGLGGYRCEDNYLVTGGGAENLSGFHRGLTPDLSSQS